MSDTRSNMIRLLVVDDHPVVRDGLVAMLGTQADFVVVGEASNGLDALAQLHQLAPDVVLLDLEMPQMDGVQALRQMIVDRPNTRVIVFTAFDTDERILAAIQAGAQGYLLKGAPRDELFRAIRVTHQGGSLLQPVITNKLLNSVRNRVRHQVRNQAHDQTRSNVDKWAEPLTERELEVLRLLADGRSNKAIAAELHITERTVKFHVSGIFGKLGAGNRTEAVKLAREQNLLR